MPPIYYIYHYLVSIELECTLESNAASVNYPLYLISNYVFIPCNHPHQREDSFAVCYPCFLFYQLAPPPIQ